MQGLLLHIYWTLYPYHVDIHSIPGKGNDLVHQSRLMTCVNDESVRDLITFYDMDAWQTEWWRSMVDQSRRPYPSSDNLVHQSRLTVCVNGEGVRDLITFYDVDVCRTEGWEIHDGSIMKHGVSEGHRRMYLIFSRVLCWRDDMWSPSR